MDITSANICNVYCVRGIIHEPDALPRRVTRKDNTRAAGDIFN